MAKKEPKIYDVSKGASADRDLYLSFVTKIVSSGFVSAAELRTEFGGEAFTKCIAVLFRTHRMLREVPRKAGDDGQSVLGYEWADRRYSQAAIKKLPEELQIVIGTFQKANDKYGDYEHMVIKCRWTNKVLGAMPREDKGGNKINIFDRVNGASSDVVIPRYCLRAMVARTLPIMAKEQAIARRILFRPVIVSAAHVEQEVEERPILKDDGRTGLGIQRSERIASGTEFVIDARVPTTVLNPDEFVDLIELCGQYTGLSPARSAGFGDFEVLG
jgi:hypothetical protein